MKKLRVGLIGSGFSATLHVDSYKRVYGMNAKIGAVVSRNDKGGQFAQKHHIPTVYRDYKDLLQDKDIDVVDICTPAMLHPTLIEEFVQAGKHVICEKPFTGYFGQTGDEEPIGRKVPKVRMYERMLESMNKTREIIKASGQLFMYAEDWIYAPPITKSEEILRATGDKILFMKGEESHSGSHAFHAAQWKMTGGGALIRMGCHPLSAALYLKRVEAATRNETVSIESVVADVGNITDRLTETERKRLAARPVDVEDWAMLNLNFTDGTKATILAGDMIMGGVKNYLETYTNNGAMICNIVPNTNMLSYLTDESKLKDVYITEKVEMKTGWQFISITEEWARGYIQEIQDFMECVAFGRQPLSDLDLAYDTIQAVYAGYVSAEEGRRVKL